MNIYVINSSILLRKPFQTNDTFAESALERQETEAEGDRMHGRKALTQITVFVRCIPAPPITRLCQDKCPKTRVKYYIIRYQTFMKLNRRKAVLQVHYNTNPL